ncbi:MAG: winged helix-turn-helix domain-containing protein [Gammaproteobacteria bacterium]
MQTFRFGDFELDLDACELRRHGEPVRLERRPLDLLIMLVRRHGQLVARDEIIASLWPQRVIIDFESGLNTLVRKVRYTLGDSPDNPEFVDTVPGRGYRFIAPVVAVTRSESDPSSETLPPSPVAARNLTRQPWFRPALVSIIVAAALSLVWLAGESEREAVRIAVLPFWNLTGSEELAYLPAGLTEDAIDSLRKVEPERLHVVGVARGLVDLALPITDIGQRVDVDYVVESSLQLDGKLIRLTSKLWRVSDGVLVWGDAFDRELTRPLGLQRELAIAIAEQVRLRLSPEVRGEIERRQTQNPVAYDLYLQGRYQWLKLTPDSMRRAMEYFSQATREDPRYELAWAGLAFAAITSIRTADGRPSEMKPLALDALRHAQALGGALVETQYAIGYYSLFGDLDTEAAEDAARLAIRLDPNNAQAHMLLAVSIGAKPVEAMEMIKRSRELDPTFAIAFANSAYLALAAGDPEGAMEFARQTVAMSPEFWVGYYYLGMALAASGDSEGALDALADAARFSDGHSMTYLARITTLVALGRLDKATDLLDELMARAERQYVPAYTLGVAHALFGETDAAFESLARAIEERDVGLPALPGDARLNSLRDDPRFEALLAGCACLEESDRRSGQGTN